jgi:hypothetical protein
VLRLTGVDARRNEQAPFPRGVQRQAITERQFIDAPLLFLPRPGQLPGVPGGHLGVRQHVGSDAYKQRKQALLALAETLLAREVLQKRSQPAADGDESVGAILAVFRYRLIPDLLLDVTLIKTMLDGPDAAACSRFSSFD